MTAVPREVRERLATLAAHQANQIAAGRFVWTEPDFDFDAEDSYAAYLYELHPEVVSGLLADLEAAEARAEASDSITTEWLDAAQRAETAEDELLIANERGDAWRAQVAEDTVRLEAAEQRAETAAALLRGEGHARGEDELSGRSQGRCVRCAEAWPCEVAIFSADYDAALADRERTP